MKYIISGIIILFILVIIFYKKIKQIWFEIPFFKGGIETHTQENWKGGQGGNAKAGGSKSTAIGGKGGNGGPWGKGGDGGNAETTTDNSFVMGGEGGEAGQIDRVGKGGRGPLHVLMEDYPEKFREISDNFGITEEMAKKYGKGGNGKSPLTP